MSSAGGIHVDCLRGEGGGANIIEDSMGGQKGLCANQVAPDGVSEKAAQNRPGRSRSSHSLCNTYSEFLFPYSTRLIRYSSQRIDTHNHIMQRIPWAWEVFADLFIISDIASKGRTASADDCWQAQHSDTSPRRFMHS